MSIFRSYLSAKIRGAAWAVPIEDRKTAEKAVKARRDRRLDDVIPVFTAMFCEICDCKGFLFVWKKREGDVRFIVVMQ